MSPLRPMRVYVSGPMRGAPDHVAAFTRATEILRRGGHAVVNPHEINEAWAADMAARGIVLEGPDYIRRDILELLNCDAIALLPGWETSVGARCDLAIAFTLGLSRLHYFDGTDAVGEPAPSVVLVSALGYRAEPGPVESLDALREENIVWANATFGEGATRRRACWAHMAQEVGELLDAPDDVEEMADVFLLLAHGSQGVDLAGAVRAKLEKNKRRQWGQPDADGVVNHTAEAPAPVEIRP